MSKKILLIKIQRFKRKKASFETLQGRIGKSEKSRQFRTMSMNLFGKI